MFTVERVVLYFIRSETMSFQYNGFVSARDGKVINTEGDPDSPINRGSLCSKGGSIYQMAVNENRLGKPLYRAPNAAEWKE